MPSTLDHAVDKARRLTADAVLLMRCLTVGCAIFWMAGCATDSAPRGSRFVVSTPVAEFYKNGPAQDLEFAQQSFGNYLTEQQLGPDFQLPKGTYVTMLKREFGYSRVMTDNGVAGYVANEQLRPAPAVARMAPVEPPTVRSSRERIRNNPPAHKPDEQLDMNDLPLPI